MEFRQKCIVRRTSLIVGTSLVLIATLRGSYAGDWSLESKSSEIADFSDNYALKQKSDGYVFGSTTALNADAIYKGHDFRFDAVGDISYRRFFGTGSQSISDVLSPRLQTKFNKRSKISSFDFSADFARTDASAVDVLDAIIITNKTYRDTITASAAYSAAFGPRNTFGVNASLQNVMFENNADNLTPSIYGIVGTFASRRLTKLTNAKLSNNASWLVLDDAAKTERKTLTTRVDFDSQVSQRLKFGVGGGVRVTFSRQSEGIPPFVSPRNATALGWVGDIRMDYAYKLGAISAFASQSTEPSALGDLQTRYTFGLSASRKLTDASDFVIVMQYRIADVTPDETQTVVSIAPSFSHRFSKDWNLQTGYRFTQVKGNSGIARSNNLFLSVTKSLTLSP